MPPKLANKDLLKLELDSVFELHPPQAKIWRDTKYNALIVTTSQNDHPSEDSGRYEFIATVEEASAEYEVLAAQRKGPALCRRAYFCPNVQLVEDPE